MQIVYSSYWFYKLQITLHLESIQTKKSGNKLGLFPLFLNFIKVIYILKINSMECCK